MTDETRAPAPWWVLALVGVGSALVGLLPWMRSGLRLPLQNLWTLDTMPGEMPLALLPFSQYALTLIVAVLVVGSVLGGVLARANRRRFGGRVAAIALGVLAVQLVALVQTGVVVAQGVGSRTEGILYLLALVLGTAVTILIGAGMLVLVARAPVAVATGVLAVAAVPAGTWAGTLLVPFGSVAELDPALSEVVSLSFWVPGVLVGAALVWCGVGSAGRILAWLFSLAALWVLPALFTALSAATGTRVLARRPLEMIDYGWSLFRVLLTGEGLQGRLLATALVIGIGGSVVRLLVARVAWKGDRRRARTGEPARP